MKPSLDKTSLLIGFYLCLHFHYCLLQEQGLGQGATTSQSPSPLSSVKVNSSNNSSNSGDSDNDRKNRDDKSIVSSSVNLYKCLGRLHETDETRVQVPAPFMSDNRTHSFPLKRKELNCKKGRFKVIFQVENEDLSQDTRLHPPKPSAKILKTDKLWQTSSHEDNSIKIMRDGAYLHVANDFFHPSEYCFDQTDPKSELSLFVCNPECYGQRPCITKCCAQDQVWDVENKECRSARVWSGNVEEKIKSSTNGWNSTVTTIIPSPRGSGTSDSLTGTIWKPSLFSRSKDNCVKRVTSFHREQLSVHLQQRLPSCDPLDYQLIPLRKLRNLAFQRFRILWSGQVIVRDKYGNWSEFTPGRYCVDGMVNFKSRHLLGSGMDDGGEGQGYSGAFEDQVLLVCPDQMPEAIRKKPIPFRYALMLVVAAILLLITTLISILLWDKQNVYEWTVCCEVMSMFFLILCVGVAHTVARKPEKSDFGAMHCIFIGAASHFFWLATFCWLFIINFEIWWNFRSLVQLRQSRKWFRFGMYQLVGWGFPFLVVGTGLLLDRTWGLQNEDLDCTDIIVPNYGQLNCYISKPAQGPYLFYPIGVILICNLIFYLLTVCKMWGYQKKSQAIIQYRSRVQTQPILIFAKLFIVMGVSWIFEIVAWAVTASEVDKIPLYWVIFDMVTLFQAISIFVIFTWKKEVLSRLWHKFPACQGCLSPLTKLPGCGILPNEREQRMASLHHMQYSPNKIPRDQRNPSTATVSGVMIVPPSSSGYSSSNNSNDGGLGGNGISGGGAGGTSSASTSNNNINQNSNHFERQLPHNHRVQQLGVESGPSSTTQPVSMSSSSI